MFELKIDSPMATRFASEGAHYFLHNKTFQLPIYVTESPAVELEEFDLLTSLTNHQK